ncbi:MAG: hypothetical protein AAFP92_18360 [Bacteroidota bacterium]
MSNYPLVKIPTHIKQEPSTMILQDVDDYFEWFMSIKTQRLEKFCAKLFDSNHVKVQRSSLQAIQYFFCENLTTRRRTKEEIELEKAKLPEALKVIHQIPEYEIIEPSFSIMFDAGIYYGELLCEEIDGVNWSIERDKKMASFGKPILIKKGIEQVVNPLGVFYVMALRIQKETLEEDMLINTYQKSKGSLEGKKRKDYLSMVEQWSKKKK